MAKLSKAQAKAHSEACALVALDRPLTDDEKEFIVRNWNEAANHVNTLSGAHFTPLDMAMDVVWDVAGPRVLDLCAGIGILGLAAVWRNVVDEKDLVCIELNPDYVAVGKRLLPKATWICADAFTFPSLGLGPFDTIMSNPPFGKVSKSTKGPRYTGGDFELCLLDLASDHCGHICFVLPQMSAPFRYSGQPSYQRISSPKTDQFFEQTGLALQCGVGVDTAMYRDEWKTTSIVCEIVQCETAERVLAETPAAAPIPVSDDEQPDLFGEVAA